MKIKNIFIYSIFVSLVSISLCNEFSNNTIIPEQIHISYFEAGKLSFTWVTNASTDDSLVKYRLNGTDNEFNITSGNSKPFNPGNRTIYNHHVIINNLEYNTTYEYYVGSTSFMSDVLTVRVPHNTNNKKISFVVYADYGFVNSVSTEAIKNVILDGRVDMVLHAGDMAYDLNTNNGTRGDEFMRMIQPFSSAIPYQVCPGNHEYFNNFEHYKARFTLPGKSEGMWYSINVPNIHIIAISTEVYFSDRKQDIVEQYLWLENDLKNAVKNRELYPWIFMYGHRPMYCSEISLVDYGRDEEIQRLDTNEENHFEGCIEDTELIRDGINIFGKRFFGLEKLMNKYGIDLFICGHEHIYERLYPVYKNIVDKQNINTYINPKYTTHIITGSPGCQEGLDIFNATAGPWTAYRSATYGISLLDVYNNTHLNWKQVDTKSSKSQTTIVDDLWIIKN